MGEGLTVEEHLAGGGQDEAGQQAEQGALAAAGGADEGDELARGDRERDAVEDGERPVAESK